jgi:hypothetical protein
MKAYLHDESHVEQDLVTILDHLISLLKKGLKIPIG